MNPIKQLSFLLFAVFLTFVIPACKTTKTQPKNVQSYQPLENALLWKISGKQLKQPSYLFGTIHIINSEDFFLPKGTFSALETAEKVMFEIDVKDMTDLSALMGMMGKILMRDGQTLKELLSENDYTLVSTHFEKIGIPIFMLERMKPMFLTVFAYGDMDPSGLQTGSMKSYEMELYEMAKRAGKESGGLESIDYQLSLFDQIPYEAQAKMLVESIKSSVGENDSFQKITEMYTSQNIEKMVSMISEEGSEMAGFEDQLLNQRNKNWIPIIIKSAQTQSVLFAVGAGHLAGPEGVIHLLRKEGLTVTPVR